MIISYFTCFNCIALRAVSKPLLLLLLLFRSRVVVQTKLFDDNCRHTKTHTNVDKHSEAFGFRCQAVNVISRQVHVVKNETFYTRSTKQNKQTNDSYFVFSFNLMNSRISLFLSPARSQYILLLS